MQQVMSLLDALAQLLRSGEPLTPLVCGMRLPLGLFTKDLAPHSDGFFSAAGIWNNREITFFVHRHAPAEIVIGLDEPYPVEPGLADRVLGPEQKVYPDRRGPGCLIRFEHKGVTAGLLLAGDPTGIVQIACDERPAPPKRHPLSSSEEAVLEDMDVNVHLITRATADRLLRVLTRQASELNSALLELRAITREEEFRAARRLVGSVMGEHYLCGMRPLFKLYPNLEPDELKER